MTLNNELHFIIQIWIAGPHVDAAWVTIAAFNHVAVAKNYARMLAGDTVRVIDARNSTIIFEHKS